ATAESSEEQIQGIRVGDRSSKIFGDRRILGLSSPASRSSPEFSLELRLKKVTELQRLILEVRQQYS
ncbi:hypothetical protein LINGRAHAP2_LOCUS4862, partial [Linum grandiflorum]